MNIGCPILCEVSDKFNELYGVLVSEKTYEELIDLMADEMINVSSIMGSKQFTEYLSGIEEYANKNGYHLTHPEDYYFEAMGIKNGTN